MTLRPTLHGTELNPKDISFKMVSEGLDREIRRGH